MNDTCFVGAEYRLHWFEFEDKALVNAMGIEMKNVFPINIEYNNEKHELCISTKSDLRIVDARNG